MATDLKPADLAHGLYLSSGIPMRVIRAYARQIVQRFRPDLIVLFGSYAYGTPHAESDVDLLVVMPCRNELDQAAKISFELPSPFPCDLLVRKPKELAWRIRERESFTTEIMSKGKILHEKVNSRMGPKSRVRLPIRPDHGPGR